MERNREPEINSQIWSTHLPKDAKITQWGNGAGTTECLHAE